LTTNPSLHLTDFLKVFEIACDASGVNISGVKSQESDLVVCFGKKLNEAKHHHDNYDREFYDVV